MYLICIDMYIRTYEVDIVEYTVRIFFLYVSLCWVKSLWMLYIWIINRVSFWLCPVREEKYSQQVWETAFHHSLPWHLWEQLNFTVCEHSSLRGAKDHRRDILRILKDCILLSLKKTTKEIKKNKKCICVWKL